MEEIKQVVNYNSIGNKLSDFKILKELGRGSYGIVYTVKSNLDDLVYVMKKMELNNLKEKQQKECWKEVSILKKVNHPNIIKYYSSFLENDCLYIIMEYAENGDLYSLIKHYKRHMKVFDEIDLWRIADEILIGLDYLHSHKIIHRDIKCLNLFITKDKHIKIGDLGVSTIVSNMNALHCTRVGTPLYLSPELVKQIPYDFKIDMWSFGCSLYHLACLEPPFTGDNIIVLGNNIVKGRQKPIPSQYSPELGKFIDTLLNKRPDKRPSAKEGFDFFTNEIKDRIKKIKLNKEEGIKPRPFSSLGNKILSFNKEELQLKDVDKKNHEKDNEQNRAKQIEMENEKEKEQQIEKEREKTIQKDKDLQREIKRECEKEREREQIKAFELDVHQNNNIKNKDNNENINNNKDYIQEDKNGQLTRRQKTDLSSQQIKFDNNINQFKQSKNQIPIKSYKTILSSNQSNNINFNININNDNNNNDLVKGEIEHYSSFQKDNPTLSTNRNNKISQSILSNFNEKSICNEEKNFNFRKNKRDEPIIINKHRNLIEQNSVKEYNRNQIGNINKENNAELQFPCLINDYKHTRNASPFSINNNKKMIISNPRSSSSRTRERPYTALNNRLLHTKPIQKSSRPFTAANWKRLPNNIINININVFNIDMNKRFLAPEVNPLKNTFDEEISMLKSFSKSGQITDITSQINLKELGFRKKDFVFDKIITTLGNGHQSKQLTINDLM